MILHPRFARLRAFSEHALPAAAQRRVAAHLERCPRCRMRVGWLRDARDTLRALTPERPLGDATWERIRQRVEAGETLLLPTEDPTPADSPRVPRSVVAALAAGLLLLGGAAAAMVVGALTPEPAPAPPMEPTPVEEPAAAAGVLVRVEEGRVDVHIDSAHPALRVRVRLVPPDSMLEARATGAAAGARFTWGTGRLRVTAAGPGEVSLAIPADLRARIRVDAAPFVDVVDGRIRLAASVADTSAPEVLLALPRRP